MTNICSSCGKCVHCEHPSWPCPEDANKKLAELKRRFDKAPPYIDPDTKALMRKYGIE